MRAGGRDSPGAAKGAAADASAMRTHYPAGFAGTLLGEEGRAAAGAARAQPPTPAPP